MCDLHHHTLAGQTPIGAIPRQIDFAQKEFGQGNDWIKLYNSGNFFDPRSIPVDDYDAIISRLSDYDRVIIENHPRFGARRLEEFRSKLSANLEVAVGLETVQPRWLTRLAKQMTRDDFDCYARQLRKLSIDLRVFVIVGAPGVSVSESLRWAMLSVRHAALQGARHVSLIPARGVTSLLSPSNLMEDQFVRTQGNSEISEKSDAKPGSLLQWGEPLGKLPALQARDFLELQIQAIRWSGGGMVITVDPWDLDSADAAVQVIKDLNLSQSVHQV